MIALGIRAPKWINSTAMRTLRAEVLHRDGWCCVVCGAGPGRPPRDWDNGRGWMNDVTVEPWLQIDHIIPRSRGGWHDIDNLRVLCEACNASKRDRVAVRRTL